MNNKIIKFSFSFVVIALTLIMSLVSVSALQILKEEGQNFDILNIEVEGFTTPIQDLPEKEEVSVLVTLQNKGASYGCGYVEAGFYARQFLDQWGYFPLSTLPLATLYTATNCIPSEIYVTNSKVCLKAGERLTTEIKVLVPRIERGEENDYGLASVAFRGCYFDGEGLTMDHGFKLVSIDEAFWELPGTDNTPEEYCNNAKTDGTETDFNCGGLCAEELGKKCEAEFACVKSSDCATGLVCSYGICSTYGDAYGDSISQGTLTWLWVTIAGLLAVVLVVVYFKKVR